MPKLPVISGKRLVKALERIGFVSVRQAGSHVLLEHLDGRLVSVPVHAGRDLPPGTLRGILNDLKISPDELRKSL